MVMVPLCALGLAIAKPLVQLLYGTNFLPMVVPLQILIISLAFTCIGGVGSPLLVGTGKQSFIAKYGTFVAVLNLTMDFYLIPTHGAYGAAIANCTAQIVGVLGGTIYVLRYVQAAFPWKSTIAIYLSSAVAVAPAVYCFSHPQLGIAVQAASVALGAVLYLGLLVAVGQLGKSDVGALRAAFMAKMPQNKPAEAKLV
jgi:O-antigen/teichoic acid export membrane protein